MDFNFLNSFPQIAKKSENGQMLLSLCSEGYCSKELTDWPNIVEHAT